ALKDQNGAATTATVVWSSFASRRTSIADVAGNARMMRGYIDTSATSTTTVSVSGLPAATYAIYVYADSDNPNDARTASYAISGSGVAPASIKLIDAASVNFSTTFTEAGNSNGNYVRFVAMGTAFTITATPVAGSTKRAPINAIEVVPVQPDFTMSAQPGSVTIAAGGAASSTVVIGAINGFTGPVGFAVSGLPAASTALVTPSALAG